MYHHPTPCLWVSTVIKLKRAGNWSAYVHFRYVVSPFRAGSATVDVFIDRSSSEGEFTNVYNILQHLPAQVIM